MRRPRRAAAAKLGRAEQSEQHAARYFGDAVDGASGATETEGSGEAMAKIVETIRPGFIFDPGDGREIVLRKVEVRTG